MEAANFFTHNLPSITELQNTALMKKVSEEEVNNIINLLPNNKAPGSDGLTYEFYKGIKEKIIPILTRLFNFCLETGNIPRS